MPRPKLHSDDAVLEGASAVLLRTGPIQFTLSDVAQAVGISRAALIQRFQNKTVLLHRLADRDVALTRAYLDSFPPGRSLDDLWRFLSDIVLGMGDGAGFQVRLLIAWSEAVDPVLKRRGAERYRMVQAAIAQRMPEEVSDPAVTAEHLHAVIAGATMQWLVADERPLGAFVLERLAAAIRIAFPDYRPAT
ncbi:MAG: TetR/AcrR family transcriptional regulator [Alphaproteobacteria bacterium]|nr:TetR/AcrR family transcriptional regulator [Alphaproteobacteria bacterium]MBU1513768.1 TetR/AcrR family transcriptional regulator [Alphaproteobacteria bacterium]MBU2094587.1 TetR/AcrR family transcriptional regulator [Alphaproteobacteria bacterium]MBU2149654.1 TetR/AcrR family transcriptional regulator [Alphaproteobacteria bacterium]MBU2309127.1 TetR/AcrR family transcriptional regulator [Alphaproteobacteria bacterium]